MQFKQTLLPAVLVGGLAVAPSIFADEATDTIKDLRKHIEELDQKVRILERKDELEHEATAERAKSAAAVSIGSGGFQVRSADTNFLIKIRGYVQADGRWYAIDRVDTSARDTFLMRRVRPIIEGTVFDKFD